MTDTDTRPLTRGEFRKAMEAMRCYCATGYACPRCAALATLAPAEAATPCAEPERPYPCAAPGCTVMRSEAEGGKTFTVCDKHWDEAYRAQPVEPPATDAVAQLEQHADAAMREACKAWAVPPAPATALPPMPPADSALFRLGTYLTAKFDEDEWADCEIMLLEASTEGHTLRMIAVEQAHRITALEQENARLRDECANRHKFWVEAEARVRELEAQLAQAAPQPAPASEVETVAWLLDGRPHRVQQRDDAGFGALYPDQQPLVLRSAHEAALAAARAQAGKREATLLAQRDRAVALLRTMQIPWFYETAPRRDCEELDALLAELDAILERAEAMAGAAEPIAIPMRCQTFIDGECAEEYGPLDFCSPCAQVEALRAALAAWRGRT